MNDDIAPAVRELINRHIRSMDHAEAVLHLANAPTETHETETVAARHRWARGIATQVLGDLADSGLAASVDGGYRLSAEATDAATLAGFADLYHKHPVALVRAIYAAPVRVKPLIRPARTDDRAPPFDA